MDIAIIDCRKYGKQRRYYVLIADAGLLKGLPTGMYMELDNKGREAISGELSPVNWREVQQKDFVSEATAVFLERSK